jgi:hypothetical protein
VNQFEVQWADGDLTEKTVSLPVHKPGHYFSTQFSPYAGFLLVTDYETYNASLANSDADGDGISDLDDWDFDNDGLPDYLDVDADGDGIVNSEDEDPFNPDI